jgi:hypothetical protein
MMRQKEMHPDPSLLLILSNSF